MLQLLLSGKYVTYHVYKFSIDSWVLRTFLNPQPPLRIINDSVSNFIISLAASLRLGAIRKCSFSVPLRMDVFRHLFNDSGVKPIRGHGKNYYTDDFAERYFPSGWHIVHDHLGDGCEVDFPIRLHSKLRWSSVVYHKSEDGTLTRKLQSFTEVLVVNVVKKRC